MIRRWAAMGIMILGLAGVAASAPPASLPPPPRLVAVGDLHGDYAAWIAIARAAGLIDGQGHWRGGRAMLVQLGDIVDRGPDSRRILDHLMKLEKEAAAAGGMVVVLVGNHEAMIMTGDLRYVDPGEYAAFADKDSVARRDRFFEAHKAAIAAHYAKTKGEQSPAAVRDLYLKDTPLGMIEHQAAFAPDGRYGRWLRERRAMAVVGDTLFVHGGVSAETAALDLAEVNRRVAEALTARTTDPTAIINDEQGPLWYRGNVARDPEAAAEAPTGSLSARFGGRPPPGRELADVLARYRVKRLVVAHTPNLGGIRFLHEGRLAQIDTGNSRAYGGTPSYLEIVGDRWSAHPVARAAVAGKGK